MNRKGQEEIVGFALIIIIVAVILLVFLAFSLNKPEKEDLENYVVKGFLDATLAYTSECRDERNFEFISIRKLIGDCSQGFSCYDGESACEILEKDLKGITEESWDLTRYDGYEIRVLKKNQSIIDTIKEGNITKQSKGYMEEIDGERVVILFKAYY